jgi:hypothetical protein
VTVGNYGTFLTLWLTGSLVLYVAIQVIVIGIIDPNSKKLSSWVFSEENKTAVDLPEQQKQQLGSINKLFAAASTLGILIFFLMIESLNRKRNQPSNKVVDPFLTFAACFLIFYQILKHG